MKKLFLIIFPLLLAITFIACDFSSEDSISNQSTGSDISTASSATSEAESSVSSENEEGEVTLESSIDNTLEATFSDITVKVTGIEELEKSGYIADSAFDLTVEVVVKGEKDIIDSLLATDFAASIDVAAVKNFGDVECEIAYTIPENVELVYRSHITATINITKKQQSETSKDPENSVPPEQPPVPNNNAYITNGIVISGTRAMEQFYGTASRAAETAAKLNKFKTAIGKDVNLFVIAAPSASAFYAPSKYPASIQNHVNCFNGLKNALVDVNYVDALTALGSHTDEDIYFRTDHHWQALGAYYAAREFAKTAGVSFDDISTFTKETADGVVGSMYSFAKDSVLKNNPDTMAWYVPSREYTVTYYSRSGFTNALTGMTLFSSNKGYTKFIYGDSYTTHIKSDINNGRKLLLFKDSYGNALAPFLVGSFEEIIIADYRYFNVNAKTVIEQYGITDVCFSLSNYAVNGSGASNITRLINI